jgi:hypothetical protein
MAEYLLERLQGAGIVTAVSRTDEGDTAFVPACDPDDLTVNTVTNALATIGQSRFLDKADSRFDKLFAQIDAQRLAQQQAVDDISLLELVKE